jgi:pyruvyltransferase
MPSVEIFHWNPRRPARGRVLRRLRWLDRPLNNFGDLLGPVVVEAMLRRLGLRPEDAVADRQLLSVGSVLHFAQPGAVVWGSGVNGKIPAERHRTADLDVRAVRGPLTRRFLADRGVEVPAVYGDPALLLPILLPDLRRSRPTRTLTVIPNLNDAATAAPVDGFVSPRGRLRGVLEAIASSELVVGSSLHAVIVAEALGIPARLVRSEAESDFKYADYYAGTGRPGFEAAASVQEAIAMGGEPPISWDPQPLLDAFPADLWWRA